MKKLCEILSALLSIFLILILSGCTSTTLSVGGVKFSQLRSGSIQAQPVGGWSAQRKSKDTGSSFYAIQTQAETRSASAYFTGNGGRGMVLAVLEPTANGLTADERRWMPSTIQSSITGDLHRFSAMTVVDRQNTEKILAEQNFALNFNSETDLPRIGELLNARYILIGSVTKTATSYLLELSVTDVESGQRRASYSPTQVSILAIENLTAVKEATAALLGQLGVQLTAQGLQELKKAPDTNRLQAEMAMSRAITAQRQGTQVMALSYLMQAATLDPTLLEAVNRASVLNANISSGNIGDDVRNDIIWRRNWVARLTEAEQTFDSSNKAEFMPFTLFYTSDIKQGAVNYRDETVALSIETNLRPNHTWGRTVAVPMQRTLRAVYDGLQATQRAAVWELQYWPQRGVTNLNSFARRSSNFTIVAELLNEQNRVIGRQTFQADGWWEYTYNNNAPSGIRLSDDSRRTVNFTVKADDITTKLQVRIATVNGVPAATAVQNRVIQIIPISEAEFVRNRDSGFRFSAGEISGYNGNERGISIPNTIWGEAVISIGNEALANRGLTSVTLPNSITSIGNSAFANNRLSYITIPNGVITIGDKAFANNHWTEGESHRGLSRVTIPSSVTSIGQEAFLSHWKTNHSSQRSDGSYYSYTIDHWLVTEVTIGANISLGTNAIGRDFEAFYANEGKLAGIYRVKGSSWERFGDTETMNQTDAKRAKASTVGYIILGVLALGGLIAWAIADPNFFSSSDSSSSEE